MELKALQLGTFKNIQIILALLPLSTRKERQLRVIVFPMRVLRQFEGGTS